VYLRAPNPSGDESVGAWDGARSKALEWTDEREKWVSRIGSRYGIWGFEKRSRKNEDWALIAAAPINLAGDVANAVLAYGVTKALLPARIGLSIWLSPSFSRGVIEPARMTIMRSFRRFRAPKS